MVPIARPFPASPWLIWIKEDVTEIAKALPIANLPQHARFWHHSGLHPLAGRIALAKAGIANRVRTRKGNLARPHEQKGGTIDDWIVAMNRFLGRIRCLFAKHEHVREKTAAEGLSHYTSVCRFCGQPIRKRRGKKWTTYRPGKSRA